MYNRFYQKAASLGLAVCMIANTLFTSYAAAGLSDVSEGMLESPDYIVACCDDGASVVIEGDLPEDAEAYIEEREPDEELLCEYVGDEELYAGYDIGILLDGEKYEPSKKVKVSLSIPGITDGDNKVKVLRVIRKENEDDSVSAVPEVENGYGNIVSEFDDSDVAESEVEILAPLATASDAVPAEHDPSEVIVVKDDSAEDVEVEIGSNEKASETDLIMEDSDESDLKDYRTEKVSVVKKEDVIEFETSRFSEFVIYTVGASAAEETDAPSENEVATPSEVEIITPSETEAVVAEELTETETSEIREATPSEAVKPVLEYPAVHFYKVSADHIRVSVSAPEGAFPKGTQMQVASVTHEEAMEILSDSDEVEPDSVKDAVGVDITFLYNGEEIEPLEEIMVTLANAKLEGEEFSVYHVDDEGTVAPVEAEASADGASFASAEFSVYIVAGTAPTPEEGTVISVALNFYNYKGVKLDDTDVYEYLLTEEKPSVDVEYTIPELEGKKAALRSDSAEGFTLADGKISATLNSSKTEYVVNVEYTAKPATYTVKYLFQTTDQSGYEEDAEHPSKTVDSEVGDLTAERAPLEKGFVAQPISQQTVKEDNSTVVEIRYDRESLSLYYDTDNGTFVDTKHSLYGAEVTVYESSSSPVCGKSEHKHDTEPTTNASRGGKSANECWKANWSWDDWSYHWSLTCTEAEHTHDDSCYSLTPSTTKVGYTFGGWYLDKECTNPAPETMELTENTTVYAKWNPDTVPYSIVVQKQNLDGTYSYVSTITGKNALVGSTVRVESDPKVKFTDSDYYHFNQDEGTGAVVKADGSTVVYAYYYLNTYKLDFSLENAGPNTVMTMNGGQYTKNSSHYQIVCRLGEDISSKWPTAENFTNGTFYAWYYDGGSNFVSKRAEVTSDMLTSTANNSITYYKANMNPPSKKVHLHYMLQNADDDGYTDSPKFRQDLTTSGDWDAKEIAGFKYTREEKKENTPKRGEDTYYFYYTRKTFTIDYYYKDSQLKSQTNIRFEKNINNGTYKYTPSAPAGLSDYTFGGWYDNPDCEGDAYVFDKMPASNLKLYASWNPPVFKLILDINYDGKKEEHTVPKGDIPQNYISTPEREGYEFLGWYDAAEGGNLYEIAKPVERDTTLYAHYKKIEKTKYTVKYVDRAGNPIDSAVTYDALVGDTVREEAVKPAGTYANYVVDEDFKSMTLGFDEEKNVITFVYADPKYVLYTVKYVYENGEDARAPEKSIAGVKQKIVKADMTILTEDGKQGYHLDKQSECLDISSDDTKNIVTFTLIPNEYTITYKDVDPAWANPNPGTYTTEDTIVLGNPGTYNGYTFIGWDFTTEKGKCETHSHYNTVISPGSYGDLEFTALWAALTAEDATWNYDGQPHAINPAVLSVGNETGSSVLDGYKITYSFEENGTYTEEIPEKTAKGEYPVYIKAEKEDYGTLKTTAVLKIEAKPEIKVTKTSNLASDAKAKLGQMITYTVTVTNSGNVTLENIDVTDELEGTEPASGRKIASLAPGKSAEVTFTYVVTEADILKGSIKNVATAKSGDTEGKGETEDNTDPKNPKLEVTKKSDAAEGTEVILGQKITYTVAVTNKGNVTVSDIKVEDKLPGAVLAEGESDTIESLAPGKSADVHFTYVVTEADIRAGRIINKATAKGKDPNGDPAENEGETTVETDKRRYTLTYVVEGDPVYGIPGDTPDAREALKLLGAGDGIDGIPGDSALAPDAETDLIYGSVITLAADRTTSWKTSKENGGRRGTWKFTGWSTDTSYSDDITVKKILGDETVYGKWEFVPEKENDDHNDDNGGRSGLTPQPTTSPILAVLGAFEEVSDGADIDPFRMGLLNATGDRTPLGILAGALILLLSAFAAVDYTDKKKHGKK